MNDATSVPKEALPRGERGSRGTRESMRTCVGCQARFSAEPEGDDPADLHVRVVLGPSEGAGKPEVAIDFAGTTFGRGAHLHVRPACVERACRGGLARAFKRPVAANPKALALQIVQAADHRIRGLLLGARRAKLLAFGEEAREAVASEKAQLAVVAVDAGGSGTKGALLGALKDGRVIAWKTKAELGVLFGREEVAVVAVTHPGVAAQIHCARAAADAVSVLAGE
jgi:predicted RNA-binding protein YlxR (DUF448 family)/ribosomal protein L7Ae-like RNA K-turn-binding protein